MERKLRSVLCFVVLALVGCSASSYLVDKPMILNPQGMLTPTGAEASDRSMNALLNAFSDNRWEIRRVDDAGGVVEAEACQRREHCAEVRATVKPDGSVEIIRTPGQKLGEDEEVQLKRWLGRLKKSYEKHLRARS